jgi:hypothetical protein
MLEDLDKTKGILEWLPELLNRYSGYSYVLLVVLFAGAAILFGAHFWARRRAKPGLAANWLVLACALIFLSVGGVVVKWFGARAASDKKEAAEAERRAQFAKFVADHRAGEGEWKLMISDFALPSGGDEGQRRVLADRMRRQVPIISEILREDLPEEFSQPLVVSLPMAGSPWSEGIREDNVQVVLRELRGFELLWGDVYPDGRRAKAFLGVPRDLAGDLDTIIPLKDVRFEDDPEAEYFREGRHRLLGQVMLGMALDSYRRAAAASGSGKKDLFLQAANQIQRARRTLSSWRDDQILKRNLFSPKVDQLLKSGLDGAGLSL